MIAFVRNPHLATLEASHAIRIGPQYEDPSFVLRAVVDGVGGALLALDQQFSMGKEREIREIAASMTTLLADHWKKMSHDTRRRLMT